MNVILDAGPFGQSKLTVIQKSLTALDMFAVANCQVGCEESGSRSGGEFQQFLVNKWAGGRREGGARRREEGRVMSDRRPN